MIGPTAARISESESVCSSIMVAVRIGEVKFEKAWKSEYVSSSRASCRVGKAKCAHAERKRITDRYWPRVVEPALARPDGLCPSYGSLKQVDMGYLRFNFQRK